MPGLLSRLKGRSSSPSPSSSSTQKTTPKSIPAAKSDNSQNGLSPENIATAELTRHSLEADDIPRRSTSLHAGIGFSPIDTTSNLSLANVNLANLSLASLTRDTSVRSAKLKGKERSDPSLDYLQDRDQHVTQANESQKTNLTSLSEEDLTRGLKHMSLGQSESSALQKQRDELVSNIKQEVATRRGNEAALSPEKRTVFEAAGWSSKLGETGRLEVQTRWMKPTVQETIIPLEHTETSIVVEREVHKHHQYTRIQPILDPNPIILEPRHRIFSAVDGKWHEVVGDAAAIALLGEDAFYHGKKEQRNERADDPDENGLPTITAPTKGRIIEREGVEEDLGKWHDNRGMPLDTPGGVIGEDWMLKEEEMLGPTRIVGMAL